MSTPTDVSADVLQARNSGTQTRTVDPLEAKREVKQATYNAEILANACRDVIRSARAGDDSDEFDAYMNRFIASLFEYRDSVASVATSIPVVGESTPRFGSEDADTMFGAIVALCDRVAERRSDREWIARLSEPDLRDARRRLKLEVKEFSDRLLQPKTNDSDDPPPPEIDTTGWEAFKRQELLKVLRIGAGSFSRFKDENARDIQPDPAYKKPDGTIKNGRFLLNLNCDKLKENWPDLLNRKRP